MEISDSSIVEQVLQGDSDAFSVLVQRYQKIIYNLMFRLCLSRDDAAELTQDVFCTAFEKLRSFQRDKLFFPWLYTLAMNRGRDWRRKNSKNREGLAKYSAELSLGLHAEPKDSVEHQQEVDTLFSALSQLPEDTREMVLLRYKHDVAIAELSEIFSLSESGIKMRIRRALQSLQSLIDNQ